MASQKQPETPAKSLNLIREMIGRAKATISDASFYFILWGWIVFAGSLGQFLLFRLTSIHSEWAWTIIIIGIVVSFWKGYNDRRRRGAVIFLNRIYRTVWITFLVNYFIILIFIAKIDFYISPVVLVMAASATYLSGAIVKFNPLKWGAGFIWVMAIIAFLVPLPWQLLVTAAAVLVGYLVPGYMLKNNENEA